MAPTPTKFKETDIGLIPGEWGLDNIGNIASVTDFVANGSFASLKDHVKYSNEKDYAILIRLVDFNKNFNGDFVYVNEDGYNFLKKTKLSGGEIIISNVGEYSGTVFRVPELNYPMTLGPNSVMLKTRFSDDFYYFWLRSKFGQDSLQNIRSGSAVPKFNKTDLKKVIVPVPPIDEQKQIAEILSSLDDKIELNRKINANLEKLASSLFKKWFVDIGDELPEGWRMGKFSEIAEITSGKRPIDNQDTQTSEFKIPLLGASSVMGYVKEALYTEPILVTGRVGTHGIIQKVDYPCWPSDNTLIIKSKYLEFAYQTMKSFDFASLNRGSTQPLITQGDLKNIEIRIPVETALKKFEITVAPFTDLVRDNEKENYNLSQIRDSLLPRLMSGKIRV